MRTYSVWDVETNNLIGQFTTEREALRSVRELLNTFGPEYAEELALGGRDEHDRPLPRLAGAALVEWALGGQRHRAVAPVNA